MELKDFLFKNKISQADFSRKIGVTQARVSQIVNKKRNPSSHLMKIIEEVTNGEVTMQELFNPNSPSRLKNRKRKTNENK